MQFKLLNIDLKIEFSVCYTQDSQRDLNYNG
jgi:hypothetical protein